MISDYVKTMTRFELPANPFPGLRPFEFHESLLYFGRDGQSEQLIRKLSATRFLAVVGTSGSGKSSLVRAGLLPALFGGFMTSAGSQWRVALMRPSNDPIGNLARALASPGVLAPEAQQDAALQSTIIEATMRRGSLGLVEVVRQARLPKGENLLVIADQFEELFRFTRVTQSESYHNDAAAFVKLLIAASRQRELPIYVVLTMRSDFLGDCSIFWDLPEAINEGQYLIPRLTREQRKEAITGPIAVCGADATSRLVNRLLNDMGDNPDQLPILQHALMRTWEEWKRSGDRAAPIDLHHYEAVGTMAESLSRHADEAYNDLKSDRSREIAERLFKALTEKGPDNREVRRPTELGELCALASASTAEMMAVIEVFRREGRSFLMPPPDQPLHERSLIDISHESLIRNWERLKQWVEEEARAARIYRRLAETAVLYQKNEAGLWRDPDLQLALNWREQSKPNDNWARRYHAEFDDAMRFLDASVAAREAEIRASEQRRRKEIRRTRLTAIIFAFAFLISLAAFVFANAQKVKADAAREDAERSRLIAEQKRVEAEEARKQAEASKEFAEEKRIDAEQSKARAEQQALIAKENEKKAQAARLAADEQRLIAEQQRVKAETEAERNRQLAYAADINLTQQAFDGGDVERARQLLEEHHPQQEAHLSAGFEWYYLWRLLNKERATLQRRRDTTRDAATPPMVIAVAASPDGRTVAGVNEDKTVTLWDAQSQAEKARLADHTGAVTSVAFSPDGRLIATGSEDKTVRLWDAQTHQPIATLGGHSSFVTALAFSPDGKLLVTGAKDGHRYIWDTASARQIDVARSGDGAVNSIVFSPDGKTVVTGNQDNTLSFSDISAPGKIESLPVATPVSVIAVSPSEKFLAYASASRSDPTVTLWDAEMETQKFILRGHTDRITGVAFVPNSNILATSSYDKTVKLWDTRTGQEITTLKGHTSAVTSLAVTRDGNTLVTGSLDDTVKLWPVNKYPSAVTLAGHQETVSAVAFSPDGRLIATGSADNTVKLWDSASHKEVATLEGFTNPVRFVAFSPDSARLITATGGEGDTIKLWDVRSRQAVATIKQQSPLACAAFSPDGKTVALGHSDATVRLLDTGSRQETVWRNEGAGPIMSLAFSPDSRRLAAGTERGYVKFYDLQSRRELAAQRPSGVIYSLAFSRDGKMLAISGSDNRVKLLNAVTYEEILPPLSGHTVPVKAMAFSPDGRTLVTGSQDGAVKLWDVASHKEMMTFKDHALFITSIAFSPDGRTLATASGDGTARLWYAARPEEVSERARRSASNR